MLNLIMSPKKLINVIISIGIVTGLIYFFAPGIWTKGEKLYKEKVGWTSDARKANPVGFLNYTKENLTKSLSKIEMNINNLEVQANRLKGKLQSTESNQGKYNELLNRASDLI